MIKLDERKVVQEIRNNGIKKLPKLLNLIYDNLDIENILWFKFRIKTVDSYLSRRERLKCKIDEVDDLLGFCVVVRTLDECYDVLEYVRNIKDITINILRDYIKEPCGVNEYQAIHVKFKWEDCYGEIQIKTKEMYYKTENTYHLYKKN